MSWPVNEKKLAGEAIKKLFEMLEKAGIGKNVLNKLTNNIINTLDNINKINPDAINSVLATINKININSINDAVGTIAKIDINGANAAINEVTETLQQLNMGEINKLITNVSDASNVIGKSQDLIQGALTAVNSIPVLQGVNCLLSLGNLITGILTVKELKAIKIEIVAIKNQLADVNQKLDDMIILLTAQKEGIDNVAYLVGYGGNEEKKLKDRNVQKVKNYYKQGRYKEAILYSNECLTFQHPKIFYYRGLSLYELGFYFAAIDNFTKAIELDPNGIKYLYWRGFSYLHLNFSNAAKKDFEDILTVHDSWPQLEAHLYFAKEEYANAVRKYWEMVPKFPQEQHEYPKEPIKPGMKRYEFWYLLTLSSVLNRPQHDAFQPALYEADGNNKKNEIQLIRELFKNPELPSLENERQSLDSLDHNFATTKIIFNQYPNRQNTVYLNYDCSDKFLLSKLRTAARENQLTPGDANRLFIASKRCLQIGELVESMYFCKLAADLGNKEAQHRILECHHVLDGDLIFSAFVDQEFVDNDIKSIFNTLELTHEQRLSLANYYAGVMLYRGLFGVKKDVEMAVGYFNKLPKANLLAGVMLGYYYQYHKQNNEIAKQYYEAADKLPLAKYYLSCLYYEGKAVNKDLNKACEYYQDAYENGIMIASLAFAKMFYHGVEVPENYVFAFKLFDVLSSHFRNSESWYYKACCYYLAQGVEQDISQAKEILIEHANNKAAPSTAKAITALSAIFKSEEKFEAAREWRKKIQCKPQPGNASILCNDQFVVQNYYEEEHKLFCRVGRFVGEKISWGKAINILNNVKSHSAAMDNNNLCLVCRDKNDDLYYMIGQLDNNGSLYWKDLHPLNVNIDLSPKTYAVAMRGSSIVLAYTNSDKSEFLIGSLSLNKPITWTKAKYAGRFGAIASIATFEYKNSYMVAAFTCDSSGTISYEVGQLYQNHSEIRWQNNTFFIRDNVPSKGYTPSISVSGGNIFLAFSESESVDSILHRMTGTLEITGNLGIDKKFNAQINWGSIRQYGLGALPMLTYRSDEELIEMHISDKEITARRLVPRF